VVYPWDRGLHWFPDNRTILLLETVWDPSPGAKKFRSINFETGETKLLFDGPWNAWRTAALSPDGTTLYYSVFEKRPQSETGTLRLIRRNLATGKESDLYKTESEGIGCFGLTIAPDGQTLAFSVSVDDKKNPQVLLVVPASGGSPRELFRTNVEGLSPQGAMAFTPDGRRILARGRCTTADARQGQERRPLGWCAFPLDGGAPTPTTSTVPNASRLSPPMISADGRRITFTASSQKNEVWVAHNLLPTPGASR
jgi:Tol biopolymer transport system component